MKLMIISRSPNKWAVCKTGYKRAIKLFDHRDLAFLFAATKADEVSVHKSNGQVEFIYKK